MRREVIFDLLERFPDHKNLTLAKKLYKENPDMFTDLEHARKMIRFYRGASGQADRKKLTFRKYVKPLRTP